MASPSAIKFACSFCRAAAGRPCVTAGGVEARHSHHDRWDTARSFSRSGMWVVRLKADDERMRLSAGDELLVQRYPYDAKVTVLARISDGFDPECNQYVQSVEFVRFATEADLSAASAA